MLKLWFQSRQSSSSVCFYSLFSFLVHVYYVSGIILSDIYVGFPSAQLVKILPAMQETQEMQVWCAFIYIYRIYISIYIYICMIYKWYIYTYICIYAWYIYMCMIYKWYIYTHTSLSLYIYLHYLIIITSYDIGASVLSH